MYYVSSKQTRKKSGKAQAGRHGEKGSFSMLTCSIYDEEREKERKYLMMKREEREKRREESSHIWEAGKLRQPEREKT